MSLKILSPSKCPRNVFKIHEGHSKQYIINNYTINLARNIYSILNCQVTQCQRRGRALLRGENSVE